MKFKIGGVNVELFSFFLGKKYIFVLQVNFEVIFGVEKQNFFNIYTAYPKLHCITFSEQFQFWVQLIPKKSTGDLKSRGKKNSPNWKIMGLKPLCLLLCEGPCLSIIGTASLTEVSNYRFTKQSRFDTVQLQIPTTFFV